MSVMQYKTLLYRTKYVKVALGRLAVVATRGPSDFERRFVRLCPNRETGRLTQARVNTGINAESLYILVASQWRFTFARVFMAVAQRIARKAWVTFGKKVLCSSV